MSFFTEEQKAIMKEKNFRPQTIKYRMVAKKMSFEAAVSRPVGKVSYEQRLDALLTKEEKEEAYAKGITSAALTQRAASDWTKEEILNTPMREGVFSPEQLANMKKYGIKYQTARTRVNRCHWSKDDATTIKPGKVGRNHRRKN
ncbi:transcriptional repressor [Bacillus phage poppyseed]|uniref:Uncharacterized protein n=3 Tax=Pagevirus TaxID=1921184 RepID=A0A0C5AJU2_9CAUD|nr:hypothetical protein Page_35 [Bacillus phage Page]YP_009197505.1 hypothetical protein AVT25_gp36 [Bacillus phage Pavlov]YP_009210071.1 hypothetical protein AVV20_gp36 [Bacillus phage Palmer]AGY48052.1 transcriptional repressor [Bacillus phage poppyseed]AGY47957.1 hypothetical protein Page_35 [Bacillus phage Page]AJK28103.1 hypothetical protein CPT_Palmer36 [Bacillus phage Palmer]AKQ07457.1 hypothetical protein CPT_Pavlov36 [Bacillus phage Pavlov]